MMTTESKNIIINILIFIIGLLLLIIANLNVTNNKNRKAACILSDCCRTMKDAYGDNDSICIYYNNIAIEEGVDNIFTNYYFCY